MASFAIRTLLRGGSLAYAATSCLSGAPCLAGETINYGYDALGRLINVSHSGSVNNGVLVSYSLDPAGNRISTSATAATPVPIVVPLNGLTVIQVIRK